MTAQPAGPGPGTGSHEVIHLGGEAAVVVPLDEYRRLWALARLAGPEELEAAAAMAVQEEHREWVAAGRPGGVPHEEARRILLGDT